MNPRNIAVAILVCIALSISIGLACFMTPAEQIVPASELIERTNTIVLARVVSAKLSDDDWTVTYTFERLKALKGEPEKQFTIVGAPMISDSDLKDFNHHYDELFWEDSSGRCHHDTDCEIYPTFAVGVTYLVFLEEPYHRKSFEYVLRTHGKEGIRDKWLSWVEAQTVAEQVADDQLPARAESKVQ